MNRILAAVVAALLLAMPSRAQDTAVFDQVVQPYTASQQFMGSVLVARGNSIVFSRGFVRGDTGEVTRLVLHQGGRDIPGVRK